jgi:DNA-binding IclR family transcriptional regulator
MTKRMEVLDFINANGAATSAEIGEACGLTTHEAIEVCVDLADAGLIGGRRQLAGVPGFGMVVWGTQTAAERVMEYLQNKRMAAVTLEIAAMTRLTDEEVEYIIESLVKEGKVTHEERGLVYLKEKTSPTVDVIGTCFFLTAMVGLFLASTWVMAIGMVGTVVCVGLKTMTGAK